jgi:hypothetical protein
MGSASVIPLVIPPRRTQYDWRVQPDKTVDLTWEDTTAGNRLDGWEPTHNRSVAGSSSPGR